ncbi:MAG: HesA/MoeB/ThiF family protein, partial [Pseudomonadota bacterium]|nr:HesA/MoeB/ThiF family protein [Pseudomonadota bacterium]
ATSQVLPQDRVIELRPAEEATLALPQATRVPARDLSNLPKVAGRTVLACRSGLRAWAAADQLAAAGHRDLVLLAAGDG